MSTSSELDKRKIIKKNRASDLKKEKSRTTKNKSKIQVKKIKDFFYQFEYASKATLYLVGTAHVSKKSVELVEEVLEQKKPDVIYLELDAERKKSLTSDQFREVNILKIIKEQKVFFFLAYLLLGLVQKKIAKKYGSKPGGEFLAALEWANKHNKEVVLVDREAQITVKRTWRSMSVWQQVKFIFSGFTSGDIEGDFDLEKLKEDDLLSDLIKKLGIQFPQIKSVLIDERDGYMSKKILDHLLEEQNQASLFKSTNSKIKSKTKIKKPTGMAVVGAGHLVGMRGYLENGSVEKDISEFEKTPASHLLWKVLPWGISGIILAVFIFGFWFSDWETLKDAFITWSLITGGLSSVGTIIAGGQPLVIVVAFLSAPITTLHPILGVGIFTALAQFYLVPPKVSDFENFSLKIGTLKFWWKNRITRILLVFIFSSLGAALGMWIALTQMIGIFS